MRVTAVFGVTLLGVVWYLCGGLAPPAVGRIAYLLLGLVIVQAIVGETQWRNALPWWLVLVHVALAAAIWATTVGSWRSSGDRPPRAPERRLRQWKSFACRRGRRCGSPC